MTKEIDELRVRLDGMEALLHRRFGPVTDPAPDDFGRGWHLPPSWWDRDWRIPKPGDPSPLDFSRFSRVQLQMTLHTIQAERVRLDSMETLVNEQMKSLGQG